MTPATRKLMEQLQALKIKDRDNISQKSLNPRRKRTGQGSGRVKTQKSKEIDIYLRKHMNINSDKLAAELGMSRAAVHTRKYRLRQADQAASETRLKPLLSP